MKKLSCLVLTGAILFCSCGNGANEKKGADSSAVISNKEGEAMVNQPDTSASMKATVDEKCVNFAVKAANAGMKEVELGKWAQEAVTRKDAKDFGAMMVSDHTKAAEELKAIAKSKHIALPGDVNKDTREDIDKVKKNTGKDADKAYVNEMVDDHKDAVDLFEDASKNATDPDLKNFAIKTLPTLIRHRDLIKAIKSKM
ncbi:MAG: DUF4142 domain-containing protein [Chitinophagaceae bacterium]|nr:DUF4142 domain-containing protein [Chitinophagaceae bacterium]